MEDHKSHRAGWLRAAVLGANDGIVSIASLVIGVAAATATRNQVFTAGVAGLVAGAMSMAAGEYISVSSQRDSEEADRAIEAEALANDRMSELRELAKIYEHRGVEPGLARLVAEQLMAHDELGAHMRDELGITEIALARPFQAAGVSAVSFFAGAILPLIAVIAAPVERAHRRDGDRGTRGTRGARDRVGVPRRGPLDARDGARGRVVVGGDGDDLRNRPPRAREHRLTVKAKGVAARLHLPKRRRRDTGRGEAAAPRRGRP